MSGLTSVKHGFMVQTMLYKKHMKIFVLQLHYLPVRPAYHACQPIDCLIIFLHIILQHINLCPYMQIFT